MLLVDFENPDLRKCSRCEEFKPRGEFLKTARYPSRILCKNCRAENYRQRRAYREYCSVVNSAGERCEKLVHCKEMCAVHIKRWRETGDVQADIPIRILSPRGSGNITEKGYRRIGVNGKLVYEHKIIMEEILGRSLLSGENVHHKNGDRLDNRPENLELWFSMQPKGQRVQDLMEYIAKYHADAMLEMLGGEYGFL